VAFDKLNDTFSMVDDRSVQERLAANLRRLRIARQLSLSQLARATAMSKATLSGIENGHANPTVDTLATLASALAVSVTELLDEQPLGEIHVKRAAGARFGTRDGLDLRPLEDLALGRNVEVAELAIGARELREVAPKPAGTRTSAYVLAGALVAGPVERSTELGAGDYISFPADVPHVYTAGRQAARALLVTHVPF
jgi:transcriptional regulator with XRE-family HTH domain